VVVNTSLTVCNLETNLKSFFHKKAFRKLRKNVFFKNVYSEIEQNTWNKTAFSNNTLVKKPLFIYFSIYLGNVDVCKKGQDLIKVKYLKNIKDILSYTIHCTVPALSPPSTGIAKLIQETKTNNVEGM